MKCPILAKKLLAFYIDCFGGRSSRVVKGAGIERENKQKPKDSRFAPRAGQPLKKESPFFLVFSSFWGWDQKSQVNFISVSSSFLKVRSQKLFSSQENWKKKSKTFPSSFDCFNISPGHGGKSKMRLKLSGNGLRYNGAVV